MERFFSHILDLVFPKKPDVLRLESLAKNGKLFDLPRATESPHPWIHPLFQYKDPSVRTLVWQIKYAKNKLLTNAVAEIISDEILAYFSDEDIFASGSWILVPVPASKTHMKEKGFNQTEEICKAIMKTPAGASLTYTPVIEKTRETEPQTEMKRRSERLKNLVGAFSVKNEVLVSGKHVILIDDVTTTGSTLTEARRALRATGVKQIIAFTLAH